MDISLTKEEFLKIEKDLAELCKKYNVEIRIESNLIFKKLNDTGDTEKTETSKID